MITPRLMNDLCVNGDLIVYNTICARQQRCILTVVCAATLAGALSNAATSVPSPYPTATQQRRQLQLAVTPAPRNQLASSMERSMVAHSWGPVTACSRGPIAHSLTHSLLLRASGSGCGPAPWGRQTEGGAPQRIHEVLGGEGY
jgi:hypothetical protein